MRRREMLGFMLGGAMAAGLAGCVVRERPARVTGEVEIVATRPPPAARIEVVPAPPPERERFVWVGGHWQWNGRDYVWEPGRYVERLNTDAGLYGGSNVGNDGAVVSEPVPHHGRPHSLSLTLPPLATVILTLAV